LANPQDGPSLIFYAMINGKISRTFIFLVLMECDPACSSVEFSCGLNIFGKTVQINAMISLEFAAEIIASPGFLNPRNLVL